MNIYLDARLPTHTATPPPEQLSGVTVLAVCVTIEPFPYHARSGAMVVGSWFLILGCWLPQSNVEIKIDRVYTVSRASLFLPFNVEDAARSEAEVEASQVRDKDPDVGDWWRCHHIVERKKCFGLNVLIYIYRYACTVCLSSDCLRISLVWSRVIDISFAGTISHGFPLLALSLNFHCLKVVGSVRLIDCHAAVRTCSSLSTLSRYLRMFRSGLNWCGDRY